MPVKRSQDFSSFLRSPLTSERKIFEAPAAEASGPTTGGWYQSITVRVLVDGQWITPALASAGVPSSGEPFAMLDFVLIAPAQAMGIRVTGLPGGSGAFVTCMELDALSAPIAPTMPTFDLNHDGTLSIDDLYAWFAAPADLNADALANEQDLLYLEQALRLNEAIGMSVRR